MMISRCILINDLKLCIAHIFKLIINFHILCIIARKIKQSAFSLIRHPKENNSNASISLLGKSQQYATRLFWKVLFICTWSVIQALAPDQSTTIQRQKKSVSKKLERTAKTFQTFPFCYCVCVVIYYYTMF